MSEQDHTPDSFRLKIEAVKPVPQHFEQRNKLPKAALAIRKAVFVLRLGFCMDLSRSHAPREMRQAVSGIALILVTVYQLKF